MIHEYYNRVALPFLVAEEPRPLAEVALRAYYSLIETLTECGRGARPEFNYGLAYHNLGLTLITLAGYEGRCLD